MDRSVPPVNNYRPVLAQVTTEEDLEIIFSRFGNITSCDIIRCGQGQDALAGTLADCQPASLGPQLHAWRHCPAARLACATQAQPAVDSSQALVTCVQGLEDGGELELRLYWI